MLKQTRRQDYNTTPCTRVFDKGHIRCLVFFNPNTFINYIKSAIEFYPPRPCKPRTLFHDPKSGVDYQIQKPTQLAPWYK